MKKIVQLSAVLLLSLADTALCQVGYTVTDLGTLGGNFSQALGINDGGQVVGWSAVSQDPFVYHAFLYTGGVMQDLGTFGGAGSQASGINNSGQIVGWAYGTGNSGDTEHAFLHTGGGSLNPAADDLGTFGGPSSQAVAINASGQVVGWAATTSGEAHAFLHSGSGSLNQATDDFGTFGGSSSQALGINASGQVVGYAYTIGNGKQLAFLHSGGGSLNRTTDDLGTFGGRDSVAFGIDNSGQVVGQASTSYYGPTPPHPFLHTGSGPLNITTDDLGILPGYAAAALGINNSGQIVGYGGVHETPNWGHEAAALWIGGGPIENLNNLIDPALGWTLLQATAINDSGQIVGFGFTGDASNAGNYHAFLLTPTPEPSAIALLGAGAIAVFGFTWRKRTRAGRR